MADQDDIVYLPIRRATLMRLATRPPPQAVQDLFSSDPDWHQLGGCLTRTAESLGAPEPIGNTLYRSVSPSTSSSPTLIPSSSRATSLAPSEIPPLNDDDSDFDIPLDVGAELEKLDFNTSAASQDLPYMPEIDNNPNLSELEKARLKARRLRGGWGEPNCPRAGDRIPLPRVLLRGEMHAGLPMMEGPNGPEPEEEDYGRVLGMGGVRDREERARSEGEDASESEVESAGDGHVASLPGKRKRRNKDLTDWRIHARKKRTKKEATSLIASISNISTQRHQGELDDLINCISNTPDPRPQTYPSTSGSPPHILFTLARQIDFIALDTKVFDFRRMILLMQMAICIDWYAIPCLFSVVAMLTGL
jgi:hypothetical protein